MTVTRQKEVADVDQDKDDLYLQLLIGIGARPEVIDAARETRNQDNFVPMSAQREDVLVPSSPESD